MDNRASEAEARLAETEARLAAKQAERDAAFRAKETERRQLVAEDELAALEAIEAAEAKDGEGSVARLETREGIIVLARPKAAKWRQFSAKIGNLKDARLLEESEAIVVHHAVYPTKARVSTLLETYPGLINAGVEVLLALAKGRNTELGN